MKLRFILRALVVSFGLCENVFGHDVPVHQKITENAIESTLTYSSAYAGFIDTVSADYPAEAITNSIIEGSAREDDFNKDEGGIRSYNHFYDPLDPTYGKGLSICE